ncbi:MAG: DUF3604 domain-containing protein [Halioglobus sp.]|nr:DUF3604 domain-containing protein [Halioglobus sp.]
MIPNAPLCATLALALALSAATASAAPNPERNVYFGETHVHTAWSLDAFVGFGVTMGGPDTFYKYATGETVQHPGGFPVKITEPLDWAADTEHVEYLGAAQSALDPNSPLSKTLLGHAIKFGKEKDALLTFKLLQVTIIKGHPIEALMSPEILGTYWQRLVEIADDFYRPGEFTTFAAYEWTSTPNTSNMHRNIFFLDTRKVPELPFTSIESTDPRDLWQWMDGQRAMGNELLAISHNGNLSNGLMFPTVQDEGGLPLDKAWAETRMRNEPLSEMKQVKGQSETTPALSPNDEFANYEVFVWQLLGGTGTPHNYGSYIRPAYRDGLAMQTVLGANPYKFGLVGGSDAHVNSVPYRQNNYRGVHGTADDTPQKRLHGGALGLNNLWPTPAGLTAVWAEDNNREAIFSALKRKEAYSTSGVRIKVRLFGGWDFTADMLTRADWVRTAYATGATMGGDLPAPTAKAPSFALWAVMDPTSANLDRIQIVKGWSSNGQSFERIYDVAWSGDRQPDPVSGKVPPVGNTVNLMDASYTNTIGAPELSAVWSDPDFDPALDAFYYARVLEIPTPRWSTIQALQLGEVPPSGAGFQPLIQERAWTSPIWYTPDDEARRAAPAGITVAELQRKGALVLDTEALKKLIVGRTIHVRNAVSGEEYEILNGPDGRRLITAVNGQMPAADGMVSVFHGRQMQYQLKDGRYEVEIAGTPIELTVYRLGDKYYAARSNEFGYANYELQRVEQADDRPSG